MNGAALIRFWGMFFASIIAMLVTSAPALADQTATDAQIAIVRPLEFIRVENLDFGQVIRAPTAGTVTIAPNGTRTKTGNVILIGTGFQPARFAGMGTNNQRVDVSIGSAAVFVTGPGAPMRVRNFILGSTPTAVLTATPQRFRINSATGIFNFPVGATLDVGANQVPGTYNGTWTITLNYQ
jgi:spore coat protein U-like protein